MKIYDCFLFFNELDILEIRLNELNQYVDYFVILECKKTFANEDKELYYEINKSRYSKFHDKIIHIILDELPQNMLSEFREHFNRNYFKTILDRINDDDIILLSDCDEIPKLNKLQKDVDVCVFEQDMFYYSFNYKFESPLDHKFWHGTIAIRKNIFMLNNLTFQKLRDLRYRINNVIKDGGWHISFASNPEDIIRKIKNSGHSNLHNYIIDEAEVLKRKSNGSDILGRDGYKMDIIDKVTNAPQYLLNNKDKFKFLISK